MKSYIVTSKLSALKKGTFIQNTALPALICFRYESYSISFPLKIFHLNIQ